eukprot:TRINITY_DN5527_c0_g1_i1.p1 TRINITY_DN5527_c0_g1~~TRINITY_DN5527_c0_g1_i1.p1  ORF type:complete len:521 (-),score=79.55 TRINITY_DN5527_c0_g1_i1:6-1568(-)
MEADALDEVDALLASEFLRESRALDIAKLKNSGVHSDTDTEGTDDIEIVAPGYAPAGMFSLANLRQSVMLGAPAQPQNAHAPISVRVSQFVSPERAQRAIGDIRESQVRQNLESFSNLVGKDQLSHSQNATVNIYLGSFGEMLSKLEVLIERFLDDEERLKTLFELHEAISTTLKAHNVDRPVPGGGAGGAGGGGGAGALQNEWNIPEEEEEFDWAKWQDEDDFPQRVVVPPPEPEPEPESDHENAEQLECLICMDDIWYPSRKSYRFECCQNTYCRNCLAENYEVSINDGKCLELKCPNPTCAKLLTEEDVAHVVKEEVFKRYQQFCFLASLRKDPSVRWCPRKMCETPVQGGSAENLHLTCEKCKSEFCWNCNCEWHEGKSCKWAERRAKRKAGTQGKQDKKAEQAIKKNSRPCPQCHAPIQKNSGCNHMTCVSCKYNFCWVCMGYFEGYDHFSKGKCKGLQYHNSNWSKAGMYAGIGAGGVAAVGIGIPIGLVVGPPVAAVGLPLLGAFTLARAITK